MIFQHNGTTYRVDFRYSRTENGQQILGHKALTDADRYPVQTWCFILVKDGEGWKTLTSAKVTRDLRDRFVKDTGRKRVLAKIFRLSEFFKDRNLRKYFWQQYFIHHRNNLPNHGILI